MNLFFFFLERERTKFYKDCVILQAILFKLLQTRNILMKANWSQFNPITGSVIKKNVKKKKKQNKHFNIYAEMLFSLSNYFFSQ